MRIAVDAMGGDHAPHELVKGAVQAASDLDGVEIILVGDRARVDAELSRYVCVNGRITIEHAAQVIEMHEPPAAAVRCKPDASVVVAGELVRSSAADAMVALGHTGAAMVVAAMRLGRIEGISRPTIASPLPGRNGHMVLLDAGATVDCEPHNLVQFAVMGAIYAERILGVPAPRVGLFSIGEESTKGNDLVKATFPLLRAAGLHFVGNVDGKDIFRGAADVIVCDGFVGNAILKVAEGVGEMILDAIPDAATRGALAKRLDYSEYGGAPLLGVRGVCIIGHGRSRAKAVANAIRVAKVAVEQGMVRHIHDALSTRGLCAQAH
ncbi:MAG: phosphate acyltransferase PlsX [Armatimonadetes bacterium]|nr:phosphate acyltransferase PlsX [Armatimonadota bacterium]